MRSRGTPCPPPPSSGPKRISLWELRRAANEQRPIFAPFGAFFFPVLNRGRPVLAFFARAGSDAARVV